MSLFESASLVVTPNGTKASKLYAIKPTDGSGDLTVTRATTATRVNSAGLIESVAVNVPRLDYTNSTCPSILLERQRTNVLTNSDGLITTYPVKGGNIVQAVTPISGFSNSVEFQNNLTTSYLYKTFGTTSGTTYSISAFVQMNDNSAPNPTSNSTSGDFSLLISGEFATNLNVERIGTSNVYRVSGRFTSINVNANYGVIKFTGQSAKAFKVTGYQLEVGAYATSYIPTVASTVTRNADVINKTGITALIGQTEGTLFIDTKIDNIANQTNEPILLYARGTSFMFIEITPTGTIYGGYNNGSIFTGLITAAVSLQNGRHKFAFGYKNNDFVLYLDGVQIGTDTSGLVSGTLTSFGLQYDVSQYEGRQNVNTAALWKTRLTNGELATLTTL